MTGLILKLTEISFRSYAASYFTISSENTLLSEMTIRWAVFFEDEDGITQTIASGSVTFTAGGKAHREIVIDTSADTAWQEARDVKVQIIDITAGTPTYGAVIDVVTVQVTHNKTPAPMRAPDPQTEQQTEAAPEPDAAPQAAPEPQTSTRSRDRANGHTRSCDRANGCTRSCARGRG